MCFMREVRKYIMLTEFVGCYSDSVINLNSYKLFPRKFAILWTTTHAKLIPFEEGFAMQSGVCIRLRSHFQMGRACYIIT